MSDNVIITFTVKPEHRDQFIEILHSVKTDLPTADGCKGVQIYNSQDDECVFTLVENWNAKALHQSHIAEVVESGGWAAIEALLANPPVSSYYSAL